MVFMFTQIAWIVGSIVIVESVLRTQAPRVVRPSTLINLAADLVTQIAGWLGEQYAYVTDVVYFARDVVGDDVCVLVTAVVRLCTSPYEFVRSYVHYYTDQSRTPLTVGVVVSAIIVAYMCNTRSLTDVWASISVYVRWIVTAQDDFVFGVVLVLGLFAFSIMTFGAIITETRAPTKRATTHTPCPVVSASRGADQRVLRPRH